MKAKSRIFIIITAIVVIYTLVYASFFSHNRLISSDSLNGVLSAKPNVVMAIEDGEFKFSNMSFKEIATSDSGMYRDLLPPSLIYKFKNEKTYIPLMLEEKHGGLSLYLYRYWSKLWGETKSFFSWHLFFSIISISLLALWILSTSNGLSALLIASLLIILDIREYFSFAIFVSEPILKVITLSCLYILSKKSEKKRNYVLVGLLLGLGFYIRLNFLWCFIAIVVIYLELIWKNKKYIIPSFVLGLLPQLLLMKWSLLLKNSYDYGGVFNPSNFMLALTRYIANDIYIIKYFTDIDYSYQYSWVTLEASSIFYIFLIILALIFYFTKVKNVFRDKVFRVLLGFSAFSLSLLITIQLPGNYEIYLFPLNIFLIYIVANLLTKLIDGRFYERGIVIAILVTTFIQFVFALGYYSNHSPVTWHDARVTKSYVDYAQEVGIVQPYTIGVSDVGRYEYLSNEKVLPIHLYKLVRDKKFESFLHVVDYLDTGAFVVPLVDTWSQWTIDWGKLDPEELIKLAAFNGIRIYDNKFFSTEKGSDKILWSFRFEKIGKLNDQREF